MKKHIRVINFTAVEMSNVDFIYFETPFDCPFLGISMAHSSDAYGNLLLPFMSKFNIHSWLIREYLASIAYIYTCTPAMPA